MPNPSSSPKAFITGGSRGIGLGIAHSLAKAGYDVAINGVRPATSVTEVLDSLKIHGQQVIYCQGDIGQADQRAAMIQQLQESFGDLHVLINNAGVAPKERNDLLEMTQSSYEWVMQTNLTGPFFLTQAIANWMLESQKTNDDHTRSIINISSISATIASVNRGEYCVSKAGMSMMTQLFATRLGAEGIPVFEIRPGIIETDMTSGVKEKYDKLIANGLTVQPRWGQPDDVGKAVVSLASGDFPYSTGQVIMVDGGLTLDRL